MKAKQVEEHPDTQKAIVVGSFLKSITSSVQTGTEQWIIDGLRPAVELMSRHTAFGKDHPTYLLGKLVLALLHIYKEREEDTEKAVQLLREINAARSSTTLEEDQSRDIPETDTAGTVAHKRILELTGLLNTFVRTVTQSKADNPGSKKAASNGAAREATATFLGVQGNYNFKRDAMVDAYDPKVKTNKKQK